jgi:signal transduction histidine kinase/CHASE2 domain-containing sensor protein
VLKNLINLSREQVAGACALAIIGGILAWFNSAAPVNLFLYDVFQRLPSREAPEDILIVAIDDASLTELGSWPWSRSLHAQLINKFNQAEVKAIAFEVPFTEPDRLHPDADLALSEAMTDKGNVVLPILFSTTPQGQEIIEVLPVSQLARFAAGLGHTETEMDGDGITRSLLLEKGVNGAYWPHLALSLYELIYGNFQGLLPGDISRLLPRRADGEISGNHLAYIPFVGPQGSFQTISYLDALYGQVDEDLLRDKIIFIGATSAELSNGITTPVSTTANHLSRVELSANIFQALRSRQLITPASQWVEAIVTMLGVLLVGLRTASSSPRGLLLGTIAASLIALLACGLAGFLFNYWLQPAALIIGILLCYPLWSYLRLEQALSYLRNEIKRLQSQPNLLHLQAELDTLVTGLEFLASILPISNWQICNEKDEILSQSHSRPSPGTSTTNGYAQHPEDQAATTAVPFQVKRLPHTLRIRWHASVTPNDDYLSLIDGLILPFNTTDAMIRLDSQQISDSIRQLRAAHQSLNNIGQFAVEGLAQLQDGVIIADNCGRILFRNRQANDLLDMSQESVSTINELLRRVTPSDHPGWSEQLKALLLEGKPLPCEAVIDDTKSVYIQGSLFAMDASSTNTILFSITNVSKLKHAERARKEALGFLSHDLRSPLVSVLALIEKSRDGATEEAAPLLDTIENYTKKNLAYIESYLQLARAENPNIELFECDVQAVFDNAIAESLPQTREANITLNYQQCSEPAWIHGNPQLLERAIINLIGNATKYSPAGTTVNVSIEVDIKKIVIAISDEGIGIPEKDMPHLFKSFRRGSNSNPQSPAGQGLGLRFVATVCERHNGKILVDSVPGSGTIFTLLLPKMISNPENT